MIIGAIGKIFIDKLLFKLRQNSITEFRNIQKHF